MSGKNAVFDNGASYERFMGRWSRAVGTHFLEWLAPPKGAHWLDVGCGTGALTELVLATCAPARVIGIDPSSEQVEYARNLPVAGAAEFKVADALNLPFPDRSFEVVASALVINFLPDRLRGLAEMKRVAKPGGVVAGYVWDFAGGRGTSGPLAKAMLAVGIEPPPSRGTEASTIEALTATFKDAGFGAIETRPIEIAPTYPDFEDYWISQTPAFTPIGQVIGSMSEADRLRVRNSVKNFVLLNPDGSVSYSACANAIKARAPG